MNATAAVDEFMPHVDVDVALGMSYLYLHAPGESRTTARTIEVESGILLDLDAEGCPLGVERFGDAEVPTMKLICLGVDTNHVNLLLLHP